MCFSFIDHAEAIYIVTKCLHIKESRWFYEWRPRCAIEVTQMVEDSKVPSTTCSNDSAVLLQVAENTW